MSERDLKKNEILEALKAVIAPDLGRDIVSLGSVKDVTYCEGAVKATIELTTSAGPVMEKLEGEAIAAIQRLPWVTDVNLKVSAKGAATPAERNEGPLSSVKNVIAVASGKGGVGKSTIAVNLAAGLAKAGASVGLLDADIYGPSIPTMLGTKARPFPVEGPGGKKLFDPVVAHGIKLMSMGFLVEEDRPVIWRGPMLHGALRQFFSDVAWGQLDYLIVDLPPGTGDVALTMAQTVTLTGAVVVSTPQQVAMIDARKAVNMFRETGIHVLGIVENMSGPVFGEGGVRAWAKEQGLRFLGTIPLDAGIRVSGDSGTPAVLLPDVSVSEPLVTFVQQVIQAASARNIESPKRKPISLEL